MREALELLGPKLIRVLSLFDDAPTFERRQECLGDEVGEEGG